MRGKRLHAPPCGHVDRIIPAHAGQTASTRIPTPARPDHPRACGANAVRRGRRTGVRGSSPRMRGKHDGRAATLPLGRIIPAHAGQTSCRSVSSSRTADHPRACGANRRDARDHRHARGSSPRMRGKRAFRDRRFRRCRIIPAHAGQTISPLGTWSTGADHPRACGANDDAVIVTVVPRGSSPRMRGKHLFALATASGERIIPAHAGQTAS